MVSHPIICSAAPRVVIRPIRPADAGIEQDFVRGLSDDSRYNRFMGQLRELAPRKLHTSPRSITNSTWR
ncbi:MAG: hypothetical protein M5R42_04360 [Rhodocyclaceae bacterium]|nr:hypothetical protein [Rhodocyclaceae bacterium]